MNVRFPLRRSCWLVLTGTVLMHLGLRAQGTADDELLRTLLLKVKENNERTGTFHAKVEIVTKDREPRSPVRRDTIEEFSNERCILFKDRLTTQYEDPKARVIIVNANKRIVITDQLPSNNRIDMRRWWANTEAVLRTCTTTSVRRVKKPAGERTIVTIEPIKPGTTRGIVRITYEFDPQASTMISVHVEYDANSRFRTYEANFIGTDITAPDPRLDRSAVSHVIGPDGLLPEYAGFTLVDARKKHSPDAIHN